MSRAFHGCAFACLAWSLVSLVPPRAASSTSSEGPGPVLQGYWYYDVVPTDISAAWFCASAWGDYDNDGDLDLVVSGGETRLYRNEAASFIDAGAGLPAVMGSAVAWGDFDRDGDLDLLLTGSGTSLVFRNDGSAFVDIGAGLVGVSRGGAAWADYDNDGDLDIALAGDASGLPIARIYRNDAGSFVDLGAPLVGVQRSSVAWGDYDNDGDADLAVTGQDNMEARPRVYRNEAGEFTNEGSSLEPAVDGSVAWGDQDNDGDLELLVNGRVPGPFSPTTWIYRYALGALLPNAFMGSIEGQAAWVDHDNDGDLDVAATGVNTSYQYGSEVHENTPDGFVQISSYPLAGAAHSTLRFADYDNDGDLDYFVAGENSPSTLVANLGRNYLITSNDSPGAPAGLSMELTETTATFSWEPAADDHTPSVALSYNLRVGTTPGGNEIVPAMAAADGFRRIPGWGNAGQRLSWSMPRTALGGSIYWSVQAIDHCYLGSPFAPEQNVVLADVARPAGARLSLREAIPNPFRRDASIGFTLPAAGRARLDVIDVAGRHVRSLVDADVAAGDHDVAWRGDDESGRAVRAGVYFYRLTTGVGQEVRRVLKLE